MSSNRSLWMVDDDDAEHSMFSRVFKNHNVEIRSYYSSEEALAALAAGERPRLVLLDIRMPGMGGFSFLEHKNKAKLDYLPVVMMSSSSNPKDVEAAYERGANAYLRKPDDYAGLQRLAQIISDFWFELVFLPQPQKHFR